MNRAMATLALAAAFTLATGSVALAETKTLGVVTKIQLAADGNSAIATLKDMKSGQPVDVAVEDRITLDKLKDRRIGVGDEIKLKYEAKDGKNLSTHFKKAGGC